MLDDSRRDLASLTPWSDSLERSLERRNERSPLQRWFHERAGTDLAESDAWTDSLERSRIRREAAERNSDLFVGPRTASLAALVAVAAPPLGGALTLAGAGAPAVAQAATSGALHRGARGPQVVRLQKLLGVAADGIFGTDTLGAVKRFQRSHGLTVDGVVGSATWAALGGARASARSARATGRGPAGLSSARLRDLQRRLGVTADGVWGPQTEGAVKAFQRRHGLTVDGIPGPQTWAALGGGSSSAAQARGGEATVQNLQRLLGVSADGVFGPETQAAVERFQRSHGLTVDGIVGPATWAALGVHSSRILRASGSGGMGGSHTGAVGGVIAAANRIATLPYRYGGGHGSFTDSGYDCSGSVSYALHGGGLLSSPLDSSSLESWGVPGRGSHITVYANSGHVFMVIDGRRFDTSAQSETGSRWTTTPRSTAGYVARHPAGL